MRNMPLIFEIKNTQEYTDITLYSFAQQCTGFLVKGVQHHTQRCLGPLIGEDTLFFDPELVRLLGGFTINIDSITISCNISRGMSIHCRIL